MEIPIPNKPRFCLNCGGKVRKKKAVKEVCFKCISCDFIYYLTSVPAVAALIVKEDKILLTKRAVTVGFGKWALPSGFIDFGEEPLVAIKRELKEELNIIVQKPVLFTTKIGRAYNDKLVLMIFYIVDSYEGKIKLNEENTEAKWFPLDSLPQIVFKDNSEAIKEYKKLQI